MHRQQLLSLLNDYKTVFMEEKAMAERTRRFVAAHTDCFNRALMPAHVTASTWVLNPSHDFTLMLHHRKLHLWLQPGGHADGDADILRVALKETSEESGIDLSQIRLVSEAIFDIDIHTIHESAHDPRHEHFDIRFLVEIDNQLPLPGNDESHDLGWVALDQVSRFNNALSLRRMVQKTRMLNSQRRR